MEFVEKVLPALDLAALTAEVAGPDEVPAVIGPMFGRLVDLLTAAGHDPGHPGFAWYDDKGAALAIGVGFPVADSIEGTESVHLDACPRAVTAIHRGDVYGIGAAWQELSAHLAANGLVSAGPCREVYLETRGPRDQWVTELQQPTR